MTEPSVRPVLDPLPAERVSFTPWGSLASYYRFLEGVDIGIAPLAPTAVQPLSRRHPLHRVRRPRRAGGVRRPRALPRGGAARARPGYLFADAAELETVLERALAEGEVRAAIPARAARYVASERHRAPPRRATASGSTCRSPRRSGFDIKGGSAPAVSRRPSSATSATPPLTLPGFALLRARRGRGRAAARGGPAPQAGGRDRRGAPLLPGRRPARARAATCRRCCSAASRRPRRRSRRWPARRRSTRGPARRRTCAACACSRWATSPTPRPPSSARARSRPASARRRSAWACSPRRPAASTTPAGCSRRRRCRTRPSRCRSRASAAIAQRSGKIDKAVGLLERSLGDDPDLSLTNFLIGRAYVELHRYHQARVHLLRAVDGAEDRAAVLTALADGRARPRQPRRGEDRAGRRARVALPI